MTSCDERFRQLFDQSPDPTWIIEDNRFVDCNEAAVKLLGYSSKDGLLSSHPSDLSPEFQPDGQRSFLKAERILEAAMGDGIQRFEWIHRKADGTTFPAEVTLTPMTLDGRTVIHCAWRDITARKADETALQLAASVYRNTIEGIVITDSQGVIISVNPAFSEITGYRAEEAIGNTPRLLKSDRHDDAFYRHLWQTLLQTGQWQGEIWNRRKSGEVYLQHQTITRIPGLNGATAQFVAIFNDITELRRKDERIQHLAFHDALTGLPNRLLLADRLEHGIAVAERDGQRLAVLFLDLDHFKVVNDTLGHDRGDDLLQVVANRLHTAIRGTDTLSRLGGDEFVVVLTDPENEAEVAEVTERLIQAIDRPIELGGVMVHVSVSIGIALFPDDGMTVVSLMKNADAAMYAAKAAGKNTFRFFNAAMTRRAEERLQIESDLRQAIEKGQLELFFQPKICLASHLACGAEALVRWRHPERGLISPADFIPLAEDTGLIIPLGEWVLEEACRTLGQLGRHGIAPLKMAVNVSAAQFHEGGLEEMIRAAIERHGLEPGNIEIELTESMVMSDPDRAIRVLGKLRSTGFTVAIDDFGTGYSSLAYLKRLPIDTLKIDRTFVLDADADEEDAEICRTIIGLGNSLHLNIVAEGVETARQAECLAEWGCLMAQGYFFARPMPAGEFEAWLRGHGSITPDLMHQRKLNHQFASGQ